MPDLHQIGNCRLTSTSLSTLTAEHDETPDGVRLVFTFQSGNEQEYYLTVDYMGMDGLKELEQDIDSLFEIYSTGINSLQHLKGDDK